MLLLYRKQLLLILRLKWVIFFRLLKQIPIPYIVLLLILAVGLMSILVMIDVPTTWKNLLVVICIYAALCNQVRYQNEKLWFLKQYTFLFQATYIIDFLLITIPFFLLNPIFGIVTCVVSVLYGILRARLLRKSKIDIITPSPFFVKSSYLWHAKMRYLFPFTWIFITIFIIIGYLNENPNLSFVIFGGGIFLTCLAAIFQSEKSDFVQIYINERHFMERTIKETVINTIFFGLPPTTMMFFLFPDKWWVGLLIIVSTILMNINTLWIKYAFYPSSALASVLFIASLFFLSGLAVTIYGLLFLPIYYAFLFQLCKKNIQKILISDERVDN